MQPPRTSDDLTIEQCERLQHSIASSFRYVGRLLRRLDELHFPADDKLRRAVQDAYNELHGLNITLHYLACEQQRRTREAFLSGNCRGPRPTRNITPPLMEGHEQARPRAAHEEMSTQPPELPSRS